MDTKNLQTFQEEFEAQVSGSVQLVLDFEYSWAPGSSGLSLLALQGLWCIVPGWPRALLLLCKKPGPRAAWLLRALLPRAVSRYSRALPLPRSSRGAGKCWLAQLCPSLVVLSVWLQDMTGRDAWS